MIGSGYRHYFYVNTPIPVFKDYLQYNLRQGSYVPDYSACINHELFRSGTIINIHMTITPELQSKFNASFGRIMKQTSPELQRKWNGKIEWVDVRSYPHISPEVIAELPPGAKAAYVTLLNKLSRGSI